MDARTSTKGLGAALAVVALACMSSGSSSGRLAVSARTVTPAGAGATPAMGGGLDLGDGIVLTRLRLAVQRIELEGGGAGPSMGATTGATGSSTKEGESGGDDGGGTGTGSGSDDGVGAEEIRVGPFLVDLGADALAGGIHPVFDSDVPAGTYRELRIAIGPVAGAAAGSPLSDLSGRSVVVDGTIDGAPFTFASSLASTRKVEMTVEVATDGSSSGVTLTVDPTGWFRGADGARLDPALAADRAAIEDNVRASIGVELEQGDDRGGGSGGADDGAGHA